MISNTDIWASVFGSSFEFLPWWQEVTDIEGDWETPGVIELVIDDPAHGEGSGFGIKHRVTMPALLTAIKALGLDDEDLEDIDAVAGDAILQQVIFGEIVYG